MLCISGEEITDSDEVAVGEDNDKIFKTTSAGTFIIKFNS